MATTSEATQEDQVKRLDATLTQMAIAQFDSAEFHVMFDTPLTIERARFVAVQMTFYNVNRRDCWAHAQAKAPWAVKRAIWEHEKDELYFDPRGGGDHRALLGKQAMALGITAEQLASAQPTALIAGVLMGFNHAAATLPWLGSITLSHFLERRNNSDIIPGGGFSKRMRDKMVNEVGIAPDSLVSSNVHVQADVDHSDSIWAVIAGGVNNECDYNAVMEGAQTSVILDRAFRAALGYGMQAL